MEYQTTTITTILTDGISEEDFLNNPDAFYSERHESFLNPVSKTIIYHVRRKEQDA